MAATEAHPLKLQRPEARPAAARWGILLAGGDGTRLERLTRLISGDDCPKQFCPLVGESTLFEQTRLRAERSIARERILVPLTKSHAKFYIGEPGIRPAQRVVQPANKGTAPPILYSLLSIEQNDSNALVAILPSDHHYDDDAAFSEALDAAFDTASLDTESVVLLGVPPSAPETEYGWIELGVPLNDASGVSCWQVRSFSEKPSSLLARKLFGRGSLWSTFVMVGHVRAFLEMVKAACPGLLRTFAGQRLWSGGETHIQESLYYQIPLTDFSQEILTLQPWRLTAMRLNLVGWSDLGRPERVIDVLRAIGLRPWWMQEWQTRSGSSDLAAPLTRAALA